MRKKGQSEEACVGRMETRWFGSASTAVGGARPMKRNGESEEVDVGKCERIGGGASFGRVGRGK